MPDEQPPSYGGAERRKVPRRQSSMGLNLMPEASAAEAGLPPPARYESRLIRFFIFLPLFLGGVATVLYFLQGGYKEGKLHYDLFIDWLCLPAALLIPSLPKTDFRLLDVIWFPAIINAFVLGCFGLLVQLLRPHKKISV
jgi:hypothetical protein